MRHHVLCRPSWNGSLNKLMKAHTNQVTELVGAAEPFEHFKKVSGVPATKAAIEKLNARLAARGARSTRALPPPRRALCHAHAVPH